MKTVRLAVTEFATPSPLKGSIDVLSGFGKSSEIGLEIHQEVQAARSRAHSNYQSEVQLTHAFEAGGFKFEVSGRVDGLFESGNAAGASPRIEEIKSAFNIYELQKRLRDSSLEHPYELQLLTYGYFYWLQHAIAPELSFHLVSTRNREALDLPVALDVSTYESWLERRLVELVELAKQAEKRAKRRREMAIDLPFPFSKPR
ncbi:MAG: ATP-dependent DNA helicase, partial [Bdellovibrionales bacterium]|nr:ATP-dependent DNA helicase [Bdellovibrionales bacterium]